MFPVEVFRQTLEKLTGVLQAAQIRFHLTGGVTSAAFGEPRMTQDIDIVVDPKQLNARLADVLAELQSRGFLFEPAVVQQAIRDGGMFQLLDAVEALKLDIYPREMIPGELDRSVLMEIFAGCELPIVCRADAAASKLMWVNKGSHKSRRDLRRIFQTSDAPTQQSIRKLAQQLHLSELLDSVLAEPDEIH